MKEILLLIFGFMAIFSIRSCECNLRAGNGISSHYNPFLGCVFETAEQKEEK